jgi:site-specific recombinase XerD
MKQILTEIRTNIYLTKTDYYVRELKILETWKGSDRNKELIKQHHNFLFAKGTGTQRVGKISWQLRNICEHIQKDLDKLNSQDIENLVAYINTQTDYADATKGDYRRMVKSFYKWYEDEDERLYSKDLKSKDETVRERAENLREEAIKFYKYIRKNVSRAYKIKQIDYSNVITDEDCRKLVDTTPLMMEKAIISVLHESGCRIGEFLGMRIKDIEIKENYAMIKVDGKTGERRIPIIQSLPFLLRYLDEHLDKNNSNSLVWISKNSRFYKRPLHYIGIKRILEKAYIKAELKKKCNPHWFRHSRATILGTEYTEQVMCKIFGWMIGSKQVKTYVHLGAKQVEDAFKISNGLAQPTKQEAKIVICVCGTSNEPQAKYCYKCGKALSIGILIEDQEKIKVETDKRIQYLIDMMKNPELLRRFEEFKKTRT